MIRETQNEQDNREYRETLLSQWWKTESCQRAFERAKAKRQERIQAVRQAFAERQGKLESEVQQWEEVRQ